jgi:hypothetical protein
VEVDEAARVAQQAIREVPGVARVLTQAELRRREGTPAPSGAELAFYPERSGQLYYELAPYLVVEQGGDGTNHGSPWTYDSNVPVLWLGPGIAPGTYRDPITMADLAPTLSALLGIDPPAGSQGRVLREMLSPGGLDNQGNALTDPDAHRR